MIVGSLRSTAVGIRQIFIHIYIYLGIYTILVRACLVRPMPNYHILILGLNGGLLVKHKKNTILLTSDWHIMYFLLYLFFFVFNGRMREATRSWDSPHHRSIVLDPFDPTFETHVAVSSFDLTIETEHSLYFTLDLVSRLLRMKRCLVKEPI